MTDIATQINQPNLAAQGAQKSCDFSDGARQDRETNFDEILQSISTGDNAVEDEKKVQPTRDLNNIQNKVDGNDTSSDEVTMEEYLQIVPRKIAIDTRAQNDLSLLTLDENIPIDDENQAQATCELAELDFFCEPTQLFYEDYAQGEKSNNTALLQAKIEAAEFTGDDVRFIGMGKKIEVDLPKVQLKYSESGVYFQNQVDTYDSLSFVSSGVDTKDIRSTEFVDLSFKFSENLSDADYRYGHNAYYNGTKSITSAKMNFSLDSLNNKLINQVNFLISATANQKDNNTIVQLEPAELGKIEIIVNNQGKERNIIVNSDKISTFELLKKHSDEFLSSVKSSDSENGIATNLTFNYKDLSQNNQTEDQSQKGRLSVEGKNDTVLNGVAEHRMSLIFMPFDVDKNVDVWV
ncbi:MAG: hypothetical protein AB8B46_02575 [Candidatus Midichloriaceae bacterium]